MVQIVLAARGRITTHFGEDIGRGFPHRGIDQGHGDGNTVDLEIRAPADGTVTFAGPFGSYGNVLFITHDDGWVSVLAHHARQLVGKGARVAQGQVVAVMGNTGTVYVHNHQELRDAAGNQVDPLLHLSSSADFAGLTPLELDVPLTDLEMTTIANRAADAVWNFMLAEPPEGVTPGKAHPAGDWVRYSDARNNTVRDSILRATGDPAAAAAALAPLLVSAVVAGLAGKGSGLTAAEVEAATEAAVRAVFADAAK